MEEVMSRWGSLVEFLLITQKRIWPGSSSFKPDTRLINLAPGGKMLVMGTRLKGAMPAFRSAGMLAALAAATS